MIKELPSAFRAVTGRIRRWTALGLLLVAMPLLTGCYGRFPLTRLAYRLNGAVPSDTLETVTFWAFLIVPVYPTAVVADAVVLNLIEFWTGASLLSSVVTEEDGTEIALGPSQDGREAVLTVTRGGKRLVESRFVRVSQGVLEVRNARGDVAGTVLVGPDGDIQLRDADGVTVSTIAAEEVVALQVR